MHNALRDGVASCAPFAGLGASIEPANLFTGTNERMDVHIRGLGPPNGALVDVTVVSPECKTAACG